MKLFERFDEVFCINLDRREDRLKHFDEQIKKFDLGNYRRISAIDGATVSEENKSRWLKNGELGLVMTVEKIIHYSISKKLNTILIVEDDCYFTSEIMNIKSYFDFLPPNWDMLYMGGNHNTHMGITPPLVINEKVVKLHNTFTTHFVGIKSNIFPIIAEQLKQRNKPLDVLYSDLQKKYNAYSFFPAIAKQISDYSDIQKSIVNYDWLIK